MSDSFRVVAIIAAFNEGDIISHVIGHLVENGVEVYLIDNHSTDDTVEQASKWLRRGLLHLEHFPMGSNGDSKLPNGFDWSSILRRKEELAAELQADWFIHHDGDEIREGPWPNLTLKEAIHWVDSLGYNCIDFRVLNFPPIDDGFQPGDDPRTYFTFCEDAAEIDKVQIKTWKANLGPVSLLPSGGHDVRFQGRRIFPIQFLLRHYPIRGQAHGMRKILNERKPRFLEGERSKGWHRQYDGVNDESHCFLRDPTKLHPFVLDKERLELMLPERVLHVMQDHLIRADAELIDLRAQKQELSRHAENLEKERDELKPHAANLEKERDELRQHARNLEKERDELKPHAANLEKERDELREHARNLEKERDELKPHAANLEKERDELREHARNLEKERDELKPHAANLEKERDELRQHARNLEKERDELKPHAANLEKERDELRVHARNLEKERDELKPHAANLEKLSQKLEEHRGVLEKEIAAIHNSFIWRSTSVLRQLFKINRGKRA